MKIPNNETRLHINPKCSKIAFSKNSYIYKEICFVEAKGYK